MSQHINIISDPFYDAYELFVCIVNAMNTLFPLDETKSFTTLPLTLNTQFGVNNDYTLRDAITKPQFTIGFKSAQVLANHYGLYLVDTTNLNIDKPKLFINLYKSQFRGPYRHPLGYDMVPTPEEIEASQEYLDVFFAEQQQAEIESALDLLEEEEFQDELKKVENCDEDIDKDIDDYNKMCEENLELEDYCFF